MTKPKAKRKPLTEEQQRIASESRALVKVIGMLDELSERGRAEVMASLRRRQIGEAEPPPMSPPAEP